MKLKNLIITKLVLSINLLYQMKYSKVKSNCSENKGTQNNLYLQK